MSSKFGVLVLLSLGIVVGCGVPNPYNPNYENPYKGAQMNNTNDNKVLAQKIQNILDDTYSKSADTVVLADHFNVLVAGEVDSEATKNKIADTIKGIPSVKEYNDYLTVQALKPTLYKNKIATKNAQLRIDNQANISLEHLQVVVVAGSAYVIGNIKPDQVKDLNSAINGIYSVDGVTNVVNLTKIIPYGDTGHSL
jgi:osmotically-inducible protein OsmY